MDITDNQGESREDNCEGVASGVPVGKACVPVAWEGTFAGRGNTESEMDELVCFLQNPSLHRLKSFRRNETPPHPAIPASQAGGLSFLLQHPGGTLIKLQLSPGTA